MDHAFNQSTLTKHDWLIKKWQEIADLIAEILSIPAALIMKTDNEFMEVFITSHSENNPYKAGQKEHWHGLYCETVIKTQTKLLVENALKDRRWENNPDIRLGMISYLGFPINYPDKTPFGTICVLDYKENGFSEKSEKLLLQFKNVLELDLAILQTFEVNKDLPNVLADETLIETDLRKAKALAEKSENFLNTLINTLPDLIWLKDPDGVYLKCNKRFEEFFGAKEAEIVGKTDYDFMNKDMADFFRFHDKRCMDSGKPSINEEEITFASDGHKEFLETIKTPLYVNKNELIGILGIGRNISKRKQAESALIKAKEKAEESQQEYKQLIDNLHVGIVAHAPDTSIILSNAEAAELLGLTQNQLYGKDAMSLDWFFLDESGRKLQPEEYPVIKVISTKKPIFNKIYGINRHSANDRIWVEVTAFPEFDTNEMIKKIVVTFINITDRKNSEETLRHKTALFEALLNTSIDGILIIDKNGQKVFQNQRTADIFKIPPEYVNNIDDQQQLNHVIGRNKRPEEFARKVYYLYDHPEETSQDEFELIDDTIIERYSAPVTDNNNHNYGRIWIFRDITDRKRNERDLVAAKERAEKNERQIKEQSKEIENFFNSALDLLCIASSDGYFLRLNEEWEKTLGYTLEELTSVKFLTLVHPDDLEATVNAMQDLNDQKNVLSFSNRYRCKDGSYRWIEWRANPYKDKVFAAARDITERIKIEEDLISAKNKAEESDRLKTAFLQNMSHEIRTPMNAIMGFSELLLKHLENKTKLEKYSNIINQRSSDLLLIIEDILDISRIESGQLPVNIENCNLNDLFEELRIFFNEHKNKIGKNHIQFSLESDFNNEYATVRTDKVKLKQIFINLIGNAFKFTDNGSVKGGCRTINGKLLFYVADTGIGIPADQQQIIFERFTQLKPQNRFFSGTGLGLSIVKGLVDLLGGEIWLDSEPEKGSVFYFSVPLNQ